ncbi:MAG: hypothetical protein HZB73_03945 [Nitrosarchaeum sp.]|nr:hypothetical protein [Nitrosarchaeum sp.]
MEHVKTRSNMWYLLPIFVGLIGGIIAYWILRHDDPNIAKKCLYIGITLAIVGIIANILIVTQMPGLTPDFNVNV